jgi:hypothetical protein
MTDTGARATSRKRQQQIHLMADMIDAAATAASCASFNVFSVGDWIQLDVGI